MSVQNVCLLLGLWLKALRWSVLLIALVLLTCWPNQQWPLVSGCGHSHSRRWTGHTAVVRIWIEYSNFVFYCMCGLLKWTHSATWCHNCGTTLNLLWFTADTWTTPNTAVISSQNGVNLPLYSNTWKWHMNLCLSVAHSCWIGFLEAVISLFYTAVKTWFLTEALML